MAAKSRKSISYGRQCGENLLAIIAEIKSRQHLTDEGLAKLINMNLSTFALRKRNPGTFRLYEIWALYEVLGVPNQQRKSIVVTEEVS